MTKFQDVLDDYWDAAYREGEERRILDDGTAQEALSWLQAYSREAEANKARIAELEAELAEWREVNPTPAGMLADRKRIAELEGQLEGAGARIEAMRGVCALRDDQFLANRERIAELERLLKSASGKMSYGHWSTDFRTEVDRALGAK